MNISNSESADPRHHSQLDPAQLAMLRGLGGGALLPKLLKTYRDQLGTTVATIAAAVAAGNAQTLRDMAHSLKSASMSVGARRIGELCAELEQAGRSGELGSAPAHCEELQARHAALYEEIGQHL